MTSTQSKTVFHLLLLAACLSWSSAQAACSFTVPSGWVQASARWDGECQGGKAHGQGVLKELLPQQAVQRFFFGVMDKGQVKLGVIDQPDGYMAGRFEDGRVLESSERQATITAFKAAASAAQWVANRYRKSGNPPSARFYEAKAKQLAEQMD